MYDIDPIKEKGRAVNSATTLSTDSIRNESENVNSESQFSLKENPKYEISKGQVTKMKANYTRKKYYTKKEIKVIINTALAEHKRLVKAEKLWLKAAEKSGVDLSRKILNDDEEDIEKANEVSYNLNDNEEASYGQREESQSRNRGRLGQHTDGGYNNRGWGAAISSDNKSVQGILERNIK